MLEPVDPWRGPRRPGPGDAGTGVATKTAERPGEHVALPVLPVAAGWARRRGGEILRDWDLGADTVDTVSLLISELVTNSLLHGLPQQPDTGCAARCPRCGSQICMNLRDESGAVFIEVFDGETRPPRCAAGGPDEEHGQHSECGRGLTIVANLSEEQGYYLPATGGKVVWCAVKAEV